MNVNDGNQHCAEWLRYGGSWRSKPPTEHRTGAGRANICCLGGLKAREKLGSCWPLEKRVSA